MMSYAQGSSVGTTSTSVPECRKETPDRLAFCTVEGAATHRLPLTEEPAQQEQQHRGGGGPYHGWGRWGGEQPGTIQGYPGGQGSSDF